MTPLRATARKVGVDVDADHVVDVGLKRLHHESGAGPDIERAPRLR